MPIESNQYQAAVAVSMETALMESSVLVGSTGYWLYGTAWPNWLAGTHDGPQPLPTTRQHHDGMMSAALTDHTGSVAGTHITPDEITCT